MVEKPVTFASDGLTLYGMLGTPERQEPGRRGVILLHGWSGYRIGPHRMLVRAARELAARGFCTLRFDHRGRGDSEGDGERVCLDEMIADARAAVKFLKAEARPAGVAMAGICSGANVAIGAATLEPEVGELALWSILPFQPEQKAAQRLRQARSRAREYFRKALRAETWRRLFRGEIRLRGVGRAVIGERKPGAGEKNLKDSERDVLAAFGRYRGRALFVAGTSDPEGMEGHKLFLKFCRAKRIRADFRLVENAIHSYYAPAHEREVLDATLNWLEGKSGNAGE